jgi:HEAT repeat protein
MSKFLLFCLLLVALTACGCAEFKTYIKARGNDLADCFTARVGIAYGLGVRAQVTNFFSASMGGASEKIEVGYFGRTPVKAEWGGWVGPPASQIYAICTGIVVAHGIGDKIPPNPVGGVLLGLAGQLCTDGRGYTDQSLPNALCAIGVNIAEFCPDSWGARIEPPTPFLREKFFFEVGACVGVVGFDAGFNPAEFVDFLLGWFTVDISGDDADGWCTRLRRVMALEEAADNTAVDPLIEALNDSYWKTRMHAARGLGKIGDKKAVKPLIGLLKEKNPKVRSDAAKALGMIGGKRAVEHLVGALKDEVPEVRERVIEALGEIGDKAAVMPLVELLREEDFEVRLCAKRALRDIGKSAISLLSGVLKDGDARVRKCVAEVLGWIRAREAVKPLIEALADKEPSVRRAAIDSLRMLRDKRAIEPLIRSLKDKDGWVRFDAEWALETITGQDFGEDYDKWKEWYEESRDK